MLDISGDGASQRTVGEGVGGGGGTSMTVVHYVYFCSNEITQEKLTILATIGSALKCSYASKK